MEWVGTVYKSKLELHLLNYKSFDDFLTQSELIEPVSPQAALLGIHFYSFHSTQLEMHLLEGPD